jgi:phenylpropionate dioxygenase-like ring-hydroxylating dioxygenase large terminal subunit
MNDMSAIWQRNDYSRVPYRLYHDPAIYKDEQERVFRGRTWSVLGLEAEIPKPGDYRVTYVGDTQVVFNRDKEGAVRAFVNRCAHRGAEIVREPYGNVADFTCIYHSWCYNQQGDLIGVPFMRGVNRKGGMPAGFDMRNHGLTKLRVQVWKGIVFGSFSAEVESLESYLGPLLVENIGEIFGKPVRILGYQRQRVLANWKMYLENTRDAYHASLLHEFNRTFGLSRLTQVSGGYMDERHRHSMVFQFKGSDSDEEAQKAYKDDRVQRGEYMRLNDPSLVNYFRENRTGVSTRIISMFPNAVVHQIANSLGLRRIRPLGVGEFEVEFILVGYQDDDDAMIAHRVNQANMVGPSGLISMEDGEALELVTRATAPAAEGEGVVEMGGIGPMVNLDSRVNEMPVRGFWSYYSELMGIEPRGAQR